MELTISRRFLYAAALLLLAVFLLISLKPILMPFLLAAFIAYLFNPLVSWLARHKLGRTMSVILVFMLTSIFLAVTMLIVFPLVLDQLINTMHRVPEYIERFQNWLLPVIEKRTGVSLAGLPVTELQQWIKDNWQQAGGYAGNLLKATTKSTFSVIAVMINLLLTPVVAFYLMRDWDKLVLSLKSLLPGQYREQTIRLVNECDEVLSAFIRGQLLVMLSLGVIYAVGLGIVGLELALFLGLLAGLASVVPYLGFIVGITAASLAAWLQFQGFVPVVWVFLVFMVGQALESAVLTPWLVGDKIGLHPVAVIFAILAGGQLAGFVGILLALPVAAVLMVFVRHMHQQYRQSEWYAGGNES